MRPVPRSSIQPVGAGQIKFSSVARPASVSASTSSFKLETSSVTSEQSVDLSSAPFVKRCVPVASVKRQLRLVASPFVASASPRDVLQSTLTQCKRAAVARKSKRTLEQLAHYSKSSEVALRQSTLRPVVLN